MITYHSFIEIDLKDIQQLLEIFKFSQRLLLNRNICNGHQLISINGQCERDFYIRNRTIQAKSIQIKQMPRSLKRQIEQKFRRFFTTKNKEKSMPFPSRIRKWFKDKKNRLRLKTDFATSQHIKQKIHRCHIIGLANCRQLFILGVKRTKWRPSDGEIWNLLNYVVNSIYNFVLCHQRYHHRWTETGQRTLLNVLTSLKKDDQINVPQNQVSSLMKVLRTIRRRFYREFFKGSKEYGVSRKAIKQIQRILQLIYEKAKEQENNMKA